MRDEQVDEAADILTRVRLTRVPIAALPEGCRPRDEAEAYRVQERLHARLTETGLGPVVGAKIGCTTPVMQQYLGIDHPCAGGIFERMLAWGEGHFRHGDFCRVGVECEIAVRLGRAIPATGAPYTRDDVADAVAAVMAGIEVVDDRSEDLHALDVWTMAADDFFNAGCVLGEPVTGLDVRDLDALQGRMSINGEEVGRGVGRDILGRPLEALAWLANLKARSGQDLPIGTVVMLGSVVQTKWLQPGDAVEVEVEGLGSARALFE